MAQIIMTSLGPSMWIAEANSALGSATGPIRGPAPGGVFPRSAQDSTIFLVASVQCLLLTMYPLVLEQS